MVQEQVPVVLIRGGALEGEDGLETEAGGHSSHGAATVGLERATGDERVGPLGHGLTDEELQLADLVARLQEAGEVVALDPQLDAHLARESFELEQRRRHSGELDPGNRRRRHSHHKSLSQANRSGGKELARTSGAG